MKSCLTVVYASDCAVQLRLSQASTRCTSQCSQNKTARTELRWAIAAYCNNSEWDDLRFTTSGRNVKNPIKCRLLCIYLFHTEWLHKYLCYRILWTHFFVMFLAGPLCGRPCNSTGTGTEPWEHDGTWWNMASWSSWISWISWSLWNPALRTALVSSTLCSSRDVRRWRHYFGSPCSQF